MASGNWMRHVHRQVWQRIPGSMRRTALFAATSLAAPRPATAVKASGPFIVAGSLRTTSGLGQSARLCHDALRSAGFPVYGIDLSSAFLHPSDQPDFEFADGLHVDGPATLVLHVNSPLVPLALLRLGRRFLQQKRVVAYWAWELPRVPPEWCRGVPFVHEIWVPSRFVADAVRPVAGERPIRIVAHPVAVHQPGLQMTSPPRPFTVLNIFNVASSFERKNPLAAIEAFKMAFGPNPSTRLIVKTSNVGAFPEALELLTAAAAGYDNITLIRDALPGSEIDALYANADVLLSLHRSEGFGLVLAEAMCCGLPVVATDWSGNTDFLNLQTGIPVPYMLVDAVDYQGTYDIPTMSWAEPDVEFAAAALVRLHEDPLARDRLASASAKFAACAFGIDPFLACVQRYLAQQDEDCWPRAA